MKADPDHALVRRMAEGDADAHRALYETHGRDVLAYLLGRLGENGAAEELLHDVMLSAWRGAPAFRGDSRVRTWLMTIAHNAACNELRRRQRVTLVEAPDRFDDIRRNGRGGPRAGASLDDHIDLATAIEQLPDGQQAVLELVFVHGLGQDETAEVLGIAPGTVKSRLNRAKALLRQHLAGAKGVDGDHHV